MRKSVIELECSRCDRKESHSEVVPDRHFKVELGEFSEAFEDLCGPCFNTIFKTLETVCKKIEGMSPDRKVVAKKEEPTAPPSTTPSEERNPSPAAARTATR